jgi:DNA-binding NtrC family response regulator
MSQLTTLLVTQDPALVDAAKKTITEVADLQLETAPTLEHAAERLDAPDVVLLLLHLPAAADGAEIRNLLHAGATSPRPIPLVVLCDQHSAAATLELLRLGVADCLDRPLDLNRLTYLMDVLTVRARYLAQRKAPVKPDVVRVGEHDPFLYAPSAAAESWMERVKRVAARDATVVLTGETGTGKTRLARLIHELSDRRSQPFITVHCGALSASLLESELFGHVKGAFTGAVRDRAGKFAEVGRGTLLLDDIDALPIDLQSKLLRVVEEDVFEPVGSNRLLRMEGRLIVASNRSLDQEMAAGRLRADLYYRLNVVGFHLAPLRERREVIAPLVEHFLERYAEKAGLSLCRIAPAALQAMRAYGWPGNIRELRNAIERAVALCAGPEIRLVDLPEAIQEAETKDVVIDVQPVAPALAAGTLEETRAEAEARHILESLQRHKDNRKRVAAELGISRMTLYKRLHRYGLFGADG